MRRILKYILLLLLILIPVKIFALSVDSDLIGVNKMGVNVEIGEIMLKNISFASYNNYKNTKEKGYVVNASFISSYDKEIDVKVILKLYDSAKNTSDSKARQHITAASDSFLQSFISSNLPSPVSLLIT